MIYLIIILVCNISCADLAHFQNVIVQFVLLYIEILTVLSAQEVRDRIETLYYGLDHDNNTIFINISLYNERTGPEVYYLEHCTVQNTVLNTVQSTDHNTGTVY